MSFPILISLTANLIFFKYIILKHLAFCKLLVLVTSLVRNVINTPRSIFFKKIQLCIPVLENMPWKPKYHFFFVPLFLNIFPIINLICQTTDFNINLTTQTCSSYHPTQGLHIVLSDSEVNCSHRFPAQLIRQHQYCSIKMHGSVYTEHTYSKCEDQAKINIPHALCRAFSWLIYQFL